MRTGLLPACLHDVVHAKMLQAHHVQHAASIKPVFVGSAAYLVKVWLSERSSKMSFLELPLLVMFIASRISCKATVQLLLAGNTAPKAPEMKQHG